MFSELPCADLKLHGEKKRGEETQILLNVTYEKEAA